MATICVSPKAPKKLTNLVIVRRRSSSIPNNPPFYRWWFFGSKFSPKFNYTFSDELHPSILVSEITSFFSQLIPKELFIVPTISFVSIYYFASCDGCWFSVIICLLCWWIHFPWCITVGVFHSSCSGLELCKVITRTKACWMFAIAHTMNSIMKDIIKIHLIYANMKVASNYNTFGGN